MPGGGKLKIDCSNIRIGETSAGSEDELQPGDYVVLEISDDGVGMSSEVLSHAFDPFYTTKDVGEGSGGKLT